MKTKLPIQTLTALFLLLAIMAASAQQTPPARPGINPGNLPGLLPVTAQAGAPTIDPATGLPLPNASVEPQWIDSDWKDPNIILTNLVYSGLPLTEVAKDLRTRFNDQFDILPMPMTYNTDWGNVTTIQLELKNVRASEVFNAMNLVFENDRTPLRWELKPALGGRPLVLLRILPDAAPQTTPQAQSEETHRMVFFVGNLIGDDKSGGMTMDQLVDAIQKAWPSDLGKADGVIRFHAEAQLLVANGTHEQIDFIQQMLSALRQKAQWDSFKQDSAGPAPKTSDSKNDLKPGGEGAK